MSGIAERSHESWHPRRADTAHAEASPPADTRQRTRPWNTIPLRWQILAVFIVATLVTGAVASVAIVYNARQAALKEIASSMRLAERYVLEAVARAPQDGSGADVLNTLTRELSGLRHVRFFVTGAGGGFMSLLPMPNVEDTDPGEDVPAWFSNLIQVKDVRREMRIGVGPRRIGSVLLIGHAGDELVEVWQDTRNLAGIFLAFLVSVTAILYFALGRVLHPLTSLGQGLQELEKGQFQHRLARPPVPELAVITDRFNALAGRLAAAKTDNERLTRRLVTVQDDERRHIATELHDELGPCLFGLRANIASLEQFVDDLPPTTAGRMRDRLATLSDISDQIQLLNRRLLRRIRPMALGHVPLAELISGLIADFERVEAEPKISLSIGSIAPSYGDSIDLTVYRCIQEGITNARRHSGARAITVSVRERAAGSPAPDEGSPPFPILQIAVEDDGRGLPRGQPWGFGLSGMDERVRALGGTLQIAEPPEGGTRLEVTIPLGDNRRQAAPDTKAEGGTTGS